MTMLEMLNEMNTSSLTVVLWNTTDFFDDEMRENTRLMEESPLREFSARYQRVHGYVSIVVCTFGILSNVVNVIILSRKTMVSATNYLLTALAVVDAFTMISYLPYAIYFFCVTSPNNKYAHSKGGIIYLLITTNLFITFHTIAMWLTVSLAVFRYVVVCRNPGITNGVTGPAALRWARLTIAFVPPAAALFCVLNYCMYRPQEIDDENSWWFEKNDFVTPALESSNFWLFGVVLKVAPCVLLAGLSACLVRAMRAADHRRMRLLNQGRREESDRTGEHNRTTAMLVAVVLLFVVSELPQGVLALLSGVDSRVFYSVYVPLGDIWDFIALVNSALNFVLYCIMSQQFRKAFAQLFCKKIYTSGFGSSSNGTRNMEEDISISTKISTWLSARRRVSGPHFTTLEQPPPYKDLDPSPSSTYVPPSLASTDYLATQL